MTQKKTIIILLLCLSLCNGYLLSMDSFPVVPPVTTDAVDSTDFSEDNVTSKFKTFGLDKITEIIKKTYNNKELLAYATIVSPLFYMYNKILIELIFEKYLNKKTSDK